jgi:hypothetical protein
MRYLNRSTRRRAPLAAALLAAALLSQACMMFAKPPADLDYSSSRRTDSGLYRVTHSTESAVPPRGKLHRWTLHIETADGQPVDVATIKVDGGMPQHGHGLPTKPRVTKALGNGDHLVEGMKFNMGGWWEVKFRVESAAGPDSITFNLKL